MEDVRNASLSDLIKIQIATALEDVAALENSVDALSNKVDAIHSKLDVDLLNKLNENLDYFFLQYKKDIVEKNNENFSELNKKLITELNEKFNSVISELNEFSEINAIFFQNQEKISEKKLKNIFEAFAKTVEFNSNKNEEILKKTKSFYLKAFGLTTILMLACMSIFFIFNEKYFTYKDIATKFYLINKEILKELPEEKREELQNKNNLK